MTGRASALISFMLQVQPGGNGHKAHHHFDLIKNFIGTCKSLLTPLLRIIIICIMIKPPEKADSHLCDSPAPEGAGQRKRVSSRDLFGAMREVVIDHVGEEYRLRITSQGKLILTK